LQNIPKKNIDIAYIIFVYGANDMSKQHTVCFSGYRPEKFSFPLESDCEAYINLQAGITCAIGESSGGLYPVPCRGRDSRDNILIMV
jgi:hypothetical protein